MRKQDFTIDAPGQLEPIPEGVAAFVPDPIPPARGSINLAQLAALADEALIALGGLKQAVVCCPAADLAVNSFLRREAVRSSKIEGTRTQLGQLLLFEIGETEKEFTNPEDAEQVERNLKAIQAGIQIVGGFPLCGRSFREMHAVLFDGANKIVKMPGEFRASSTRIGGPSLGTVKEQFEGARFVPAPHTRIAQCMKDLDDFINRPERYQRLPVVVQMALIHYQFEAIHPFCDGNGRIGRLITSLLLKVRGHLPQPILCLSAYMDEHRDAYTDLMLGVSQRGEWNQWIEFFVMGIRDQADGDTQKCIRLTTLHSDYLALCDAEKIPVSVINALFGFPVTTIPKVAEAAGSASNYALGKRCVEALEVAGVLREVTGRKKNKVYLAQPIIDSLEG